MGAPAQALRLVLLDGTLIDLWPNAAGRPLAPSAAA